MVKPDADQEGETIKTASFVTHNSGGRTQRTMQDPSGKAWGSVNRPQETRTVGKCLFLQFLWEGKDEAE